MPIIIREWRKPSQTRGMERIWMKSIGLKHHLKKLNMNKFSFVTKTVQHAERILSRCKYIWSMFTILLNYLRSKKRYRQLLGSSTHVLSVVRRDIMTSGPSLKRTQDTQELYNTTDMFKSLNCTSVTLIPKVQHPNTIRDYRTIEEASNTTGLDL